MNEKESNRVELKKGIKYYYDIVQGTDDWLRIKHGVLSASVFKNIITAKKLELSKAATARLFFDDILSQRIDKTIYPNFMSYDMMRGHEDEPYATAQYEKEYNTEIKHCGFITNETLGFPVGYSPDALVGDEGLLEIKSRVPKYQIKTILDHIAGRAEDIIPGDYMMQIQAGLWVSDREWLDFISFCNGNQMVTIRVNPIQKFQDAIWEAAIAFEKVLKENMQKYEDAAANDPRLTLTPRRKIDEEMRI